MISSVSELFVVKMLSDQGDDDPGIWNKIGHPCPNSVTARRTLAHLQMLGGQNCGAFHRHQNDFRSF